MPTPSGIAQEKTLDRRFGNTVKSWTNGGALLTTTTDITPTTGKKIRLLWLQALPNSDNDVANLVTVGFVGAAQALYCSYALSHWQMFDGAVDQALRITLANNRPVAVTVHYEEL